MRTLTTAMMILLASCTEFELKNRDDVNYAEPDIVVDPLEMYFGVLEVGETTQSPLTIKNQGSAVLEIAQVLIQSDGEFYITTGGFPATLQPDESMQVMVNYTAASGADSGMATVISNDPDSTSIDVPLFGGYTGPKLQITPPAYNFEDQMVDCGDSVVFTLKNIGSSDLEISSIDLPGDAVFIISEEAERLKLGPGQSTDVEVTFEPNDSSLFEADLTVASNDPDGITEAPIFGVGDANGVCRALDLEFEVAYEIADIAFLLDTTCSMGSLLDAVAADFSDIAVELNTEIDDITFGVGSYRDYNYGGFGGAGDLPFELETQQTTNLTRVQSALDRLSYGGGADGPESSMEALYQALSGRGYDQECDGYYDSDTDVLPFNRVPGWDAFDGNESGTSSSAVEGSGDLGGMGFRPDVLNVVIFATDNDLRDPDNGDPAPKGCYDGGYDDVVAARDELNAKIIGVGVGISPGSSYYTEIDRISDYAVTWTSGSSDFQDTVVKAVEELISDATFDEVWLELTSDNYNLVDSITPDHWYDVPSGDKVSFTITTVENAAIVQRYVEGETDEVIVEVYGRAGEREWLLNNHTFYIQIPE